MVVAIGDIHGCIKSLDTLLNNILKKYDVSRFIILGDFVDRGLNSLEVTKSLINLSENYKVDLLRGNHEDMLIDYIRNENRYPNYNWQERVGFSAIKSFSNGIIADSSDIIRDDVYSYLAPYIKFIEQSCDYREELIGNKKFFFSHAGINFNGVSPKNQYDYCSNNEKKIHYPFIWSREIMKFKKPFFNYIVVHGHIPLFNKKGGSKNVLVRKDNEGNIININLDTGCVYGGNLSAIMIDYFGNYEFEYVKCVD